MSNKKYEERMEFYRDVAALVNECVIDYTTEDVLKVAEWIEHGKAANKTVTF